MLVFFVALLLLSVLGLTLFSAQALFPAAALFLSVTGIVLSLTKRDLLRWRKGLLLLAGVLLLILGQERVVAPSPEAYTAEVQRIQRLLYAGRLDDASNAITVLERESGESDRSRLLRAECYLKAGEYDAALGYLDQVTVKSTGYYTAAISALAGKAGSAADGNDTALKDLVMEAAQAQPDNVDFNRLAGSACMEDGAYKRAAYYYGQAYFADPHSAQAAYDLGNACYRMGNRAQASHFLELAEKLDPPDALQGRIRAILEDMEAME